MTRAKQGLWISGVAKEATTNNPTGLDPKSWYARTEFGKLATTGLGEVMLDVDAKNSSAPKAVAPVSDAFSIEDFQVSWDQATLSHQQQLLNIESGATVQVVQVEVEKASDPEILEEGTNFHKLLEFLTPDSSNLAKPPMPSEQELMNWLDIDQEGARKLIAHAQKVLTTPELKRYLTSGEWLQAWNELDIASKDDKSYRIDRLVEFNDHLAIIDYTLYIHPIYLLLYYL